MPYPKDLTQAEAFDVWTKRELSMISDLSIQWLTRWMQAVEDGGDWPEDQMKTRAVFLNKDPEDIGNPMAYRILKITSTLYRTWASVRNSNLEDWVKTWADTSLFSGIPGAGAEDAAYTAAIDFEVAQILG
jgi:hypothetical protein